MNAAGSRESFATGRPRVQATRGCGCSPAAICLACDGTANLVDRRNKILIVEDEVSARKTLEALFAAEGYELSFAADGGEALHFAAEIGPDLVLLDVMMPGMDGFEVCRRL